MTNRRRGEVTLTIDGEDAPLRLTLQALAEIEAAFGVKDLGGVGERFSAGLALRDLIIILGASARAGGAPTSDAQLSARIDAGSLPLLSDAVNSLLNLSFGNVERQGRAQRPTEPA